MYSGGGTTEEKEKEKKTKQGKRGGALVNVKRR